MNVFFKVGASILLLLCMFFSSAAFSSERSGSSAIRSQNINEYAQQCDKEIGVSVPDFYCSDGHLIPGQGEDTHSIRYPGPCDNPQFIFGGNLCNPNSYLSVLHDDGDALIVAVCRTDKKTPTINSAGEESPRFGDIAVIQHSRETGATCFYQRNFLRNFNDGDFVPAPSTSGGGWLRPDYAVDSCKDCHDATPFIRSPFVMSVTDDNGNPVFPRDITNGHDAPYWIVGEESEDYRFQPVSFSVEGNQCIDCHRSGEMIRWSTSSDSYSENRYSFEKDIDEGYLTYSFMAIAPESNLVNESLYQALSDDAERWLMPPGAEYPGWGGIGSWVQLNSCKDQFHQLNELRHVTEGIVYPDDSDCKVTPTKKIRRFFVDETYTIRNQWMNNQYLQEDSGIGIDLYAGGDASSEWAVIEQSHGRYQIINKASNRQLCVSKFNSDILRTCHLLDPLRYSSATWRFEYVDDYIFNGGLQTGLTRRIESDYHRGKFLNTQYGELQLSNASSGWHSAMWHIQPVSERD